MEGGCHEAGGRRPGGTRSSCSHLPPGTLGREASHSTTVGTVITVIGEALVDVIVDTDGEVTSVVGGAPLNTARAVARLGVPATFLGGISTDAFGRRILRLLEADGVILGLGVQVPEPTTLAIAQLDEGGAATYRFLMEGTSSAALTPAMALSHIDSAAAPSMSARSGSCSSRSRMRPWPSSRTPRPTSSS